MRSGRAGRLLSAILLMAAIAPLPLSAEIRPSLPPGSYPHSVRLYFSCDNPQAYITYRFEGARAYRPLDEALLLDALPGEDRGYIVHVEARTGQGMVETASFLYRIDRRPPDTPQPGIEPGLVLPGTSVSLASRGAASIVYSLSPAQPEAAAYLSPVQIPDYASGIIKYSLSAVALDELGNASRPFSGDYVSVPKGYEAPADLLPAAGPQASAQSKPSGLAQASPPMIGGVEEQANGYVIRLKHPQALRFRYSVRDSSQSALTDPEALPSIEAAAGEALIDIYAPPGWVGVLYLDVYAQTEAGTIVPSTGALSLPFAEKAVKPATASISASLTPAASARGAWFIADSSRASLRYQVEGLEYRDYDAPVFIPAVAGKDTVRVTYSGLMHDGSRSKEATLELKLPPDVGRPEIDGLPENGITASQVILSPGANAKLLRYEMKTQDGKPKAVGPASPILEPNSSYQAPAGATVTYHLRVRSFSGGAQDAAGGDEAFIDFTIDRTPPDAPRLQENLGISGAPDKFFGFESSPDEVYYRVTRNGALLGAYSRFEGPIRLEADPEGPIAYAIEAYAVDQAGNRSSESKFENISIDATSVYLSASGSDSSDGSPSSPLASLESALRIATITSRGRIKVSGAPKPSGDLVIEGDMLIEGGYSKNWIRDDSAQTRLQARSITQKRGKLTLDGLELRGSGGKSQPFLRLEASSALLQRTSLKIESLSEEGIGLSRGANFEAVDSTIAISARGRFTGILSDSSAVKLVRSSLSLSGADIGTALSLSGGSFDAARSSILCDSVQSSAAMAMDDAVFSLSRCLVESKASKGFVACLYARDSSGTIDTSIARSSRSAETVLFDLSGGSLTVNHLTAYAEGSPRSAYAFRIASGALDARNSVFAAMGGTSGGALFDGDPDPKGLQSICSAGFKKIQKDRKSEAIGQRVLVADPSAIFAIDEKGLPVLSASSPLIDSGSVPNGVKSLDWYGNPRPSSAGKGLPDIGAIEYQ